MSDNITNPDDVLLNPSYIKKQQDLNSILNRIDEFPYQDREEIEKMLNNPLNKINPKFIQDLLEYLMDYRNSKDYKEHLFKGSHYFPDYDENPKQGGFTTPIISIKF